MSTVLYRASASVLGAATLLLLGGCPANPTDCQRQLCNVVRWGQDAVISQATTCCSVETPATRDSCKQQVNNFIGQVAIKMMELQQACESGNRELYKRLWDELITWLRQQAPRAALANGSVVNSIPLLYADDQARLGWSVAKGTTGAKITTVVIDGKDFLPEAAGDALAKVVAASGNAQATVTYKDKSDPAALTAATCTLAPSSSTDLYVNGFNYRLPTSGSFTVTEVKPLGDGRARAVVSDLSLTATATVAGTSYSVSVELDKTFAGNDVVFTPGEPARIRVALQASKTDVPGLDDLTPMFKGTVVTATMLWDPATSSFQFAPSGWYSGTQLVPTVRSDITRADTVDPNAPLPTDPCQRWIEELRRQHKDTLDRMGCNTPRGNQPRDDSPH